MPAWPLNYPEPATLTIPTDAPLPDSYWQQAAHARWPKRWWLATTEPTSDGLDGVGIHALATPGLATTVPSLPKGLLPISVNGQQIFAVAEDGRIRYLDLEVDQWLTVGQNWADFAAQLVWRAPILAAGFTQQELAHALLVCDAATLPALLNALREQADWAQYLAWLTWLATQPTLSQTAKAEGTFALAYLPLTLDQQAQLHQVFSI